MPARRPRALVGSGTATQPPNVPETNVCGTVARDAVAPPTFLGEAHPDTRLAIKVPLLALVGELWDDAGMLVGYARVSTQDQTLDLQRDALEGAGCERVFTDTIGGSKAERPGLDEALSFLKPGDTLVVWRLDRLGRSLQHLLEIVGRLQARGIGFRSITESIDTTSSGGKLIFHIFGALAEFERELIRERTQAGLAAARARGRKGGRPKAAALSDPRRVAMAQALYDDKSNSIDDICKTLRVSRSTLYRYVRTDAGWPVPRAPGEGLDRPTGTEASM